MMDMQISFPKSYIWHGFATQRFVKSMCYSAGNFVKMATAAISAYTTNDRDGTGS